MTENVKCPKCQLVNWGTAQNCQRCHASLAEVPFSHTSLHQEHGSKITVTNEDQVIAEFQARRIRQLLLVVPVALVVIFCFWLKGNPSAAVAGFGAGALIFISALVIFGALIFSFWNWRCPSCNKYLGKKINPSFCSECGVKLQ